MKVGVISMQRLFNYGSFLQAYALKNTLKSLGHDVDFIDVRLSDGSFLNIGRYEKSSFWRLVARKIVRSKIYNLQIKRTEEFLNVYFSDLGLRDTPNESTKYDAVIIGSDEVFSYKQFIKWGGTLKFFGLGVEAPKKLSYAGSFGYTTLNDIKKSEVMNDISGLLKEFVAISVRDNNSVKVIEGLIGNKPEKHLDPALIYDFSSVLTKSVKHDNYILIYGYDNRLKESEYVDQIIDYAKKNKKKIIGAGVFHDWCDININVSPFDLLAYFRDADYVISETFHGTVFSIILQKNFSVVVRDSNRNKLVDLLNVFDLTDRIMSADNLEDVLSRDIDSDKIVSILKNERKRTVDYLRSNL